MSGPLDVLVVGGGPVGLAAGLEAHSRGLAVAVVEPRPLPVDKACGEGLMPGAVAALARLGVTVPGRPFTGIRYVSGDGSVSASHRFPDGPGLGVRRTDLSAALAAKVREAGVPVLPGRVTRVLQDGRRVRVDVGGGRRTPSSISARWLLACDGLHSTVREQVGLAAGSDGRRYGLRRHVARAPWTDHVEVHWSPVAEAYVTPVSDDEVGVAILGPRGTDLDAALGGLPALRERLGNAPWTTATRGAGPLRQRSRARVSGRVLLVGDAGGYVDALTGEGLRIGFAAAAAAVQAVAAGRPAGYERAWREVTRDYRLLTSGLVGATRVPAVRRALVPAARRLPGAFGRVVDVLAR